MQIQLGIDKTFFMIILIVENIFLRIFKHVIILFVIDFFIILPLRISQNYNVFRIA